MTIPLAFPTSHSRDFKAVSPTEVHEHWRAEFPNAVSSSRFVDFLPSTLLPLWADLRHCYGTCPGSPFVDATALAGCHNRRIAQPRAFAGLAQRGNTARGGLYGSKLPLLATAKGELLAIALSPGDTEDRNPVPRLAQRLFGQLFADQGSLSPALTKPRLQTCGLRLFPPLKRRRKNRLLPLMDKLVLRTRGVIESILGHLKTLPQSEHSRHRRGTTFFGKPLGGLIAYGPQPQKPSLHLSTLPMLQAA
jgi:hypothetical protein